MNESEANHGMPRRDLPFCNCGWFERAAHNPDCPVEFDTELNEFHLQTGQGYMLFYHCPFCAGRAPQSLRDQLFATVTPEEIDRLARLTMNIRTEAEMLATLGEPTHVFETGNVCIGPEKDGEAPEISTAKTVDYDQHSDTAKIKVTLDRYGNLRFSFSGKELGKRREPRDPEEDPKSE